LKEVEDTQTINILQFVLKVGICDIKYLVLVINIETHDRTVCAVWIKLQTTFWKLFLWKRGWKHENNPKKLLD